MKWLLYETLAFLIITPLLLFSLVFPLISMASTLGNYMGFVVVAIIMVEGGYIGYKLFKQWERKLDNEH